MKVSFLELLPWGRCIHRLVLGRYSGLEGVPNRTEVVANQQG